MAPEHADQMRLQQLKLYETLLGGSADKARQLLSHQPFLRPLLDLLNQFAAAKTDSKCSLYNVYRFWKFIIYIHRSSEGGTMIYLLCFFF